MRATIPAVNKVAIAANSPRWSPLDDLMEVAALKFASRQVRINRRDAKREDPASPLAVALRSLQPTAQLGKGLTVATHRARRGNIFVL
jgi:hypothetical protein